MITKHTIYLDPRVASQIRKEAAKERRTLSQQMNYIIDKYLKGGIKNAN